MDTIFLVALQSSLFLGLIHGVNPCGHSWVVLAPFVAGEHRGSRVALLTASFFGGTALACLAIGASLGAVSAGIPQHIKEVTDTVTALVLVVLGLVLIIKPGLLHSHSHEHGDGHEHHHDHDHAHHHEHDGKDHHGHSRGSSACSCSAPALSRWQKAGAAGLFVIGFMNMIVPCPTVAIMYKYALDSSSIGASTAVFASYALGTGLSLAVVIFAIYKVTTMMRTLRRPWVEPLIMRTAGALTVFFGVFSYFH
ncbi:urease accessory protein UreH domain-containing protein [Oleidesulfovibrio alaskensis]